MSGNLPLIGKLPRAFDRIKTGRKEGERIPAGRILFLLVISFFWGHTAFLGLQICGLIFWFYLTRISSWLHILYGASLWMGFLSVQNRGMGPYLLVGCVFYLLNRTGFLTGRKFTVPLIGAALLLLVKIFLYWDHSYSLLVHFLLEAVLLFTGIMVMEKPLEDLVRGQIIFRSASQNRILYPAVLVIAFLGTPSLEFGYFDLQIFFAAILVMVASTLNVAVVVSMGVVMGLCLDYLQPGYNLSGFYSIFGLLLAIFNSKRRGNVIFMVLLASGIFLIMGSSEPVVIKILFNVLLASGSFLILPRSIYSGFLSRFSPGYIDLTFPDRDLIGHNLKELFSQYSQAVKNLSEFFQLEPAATKEGEVKVNESLEEMVNKLAERVCSGCKYGKLCWDTNFYETFHFFTRLSSLNWDEDRLLIERLIKNSCKDHGRLKKNFYRAFEELERENSWLEVLKVNQTVVATQLSELAKIIEELGDELIRDTRKTIIWRKELEGYLKANGLKIIRTKIMGSYEKKDLTLEMTFSGCGGKKVCNKILKYSQGKFGQNFKKEIETRECLKEKFCKLRLIPDPGHKVDFGVAGFAMKKVSGDRYSFGHAGGAFYAILSDGMGSGTKAAELSKLTVKLLRELIYLGIKNERALRILNSIILCRTLDERFATVDLFFLNLNNLQARFLKVGAVTSYIKRGNKVLTVNAPNIPLGILPDLKANERKVNLLPGDKVVLITDGIIEDRSGQNDRWLKELLSCSNIEDPGVLSETILNESRARHTGLPDDQTVVTINFY